MSTNIQYLNRVDIIREGRKDISNALVGSFYKSSIVDVASFDDVECDILKDVLIEDLLEEIEERKNNGEKKLTKIRLIECLPEDADYISVNMSGSRIIPLKNISAIRKEPLYSNDDIQKIYNERKEKISHPNNNRYPIIKWI